MKNYRVEITSYANNQMFEIRDYIALQLFNPDAARRLLVHMRDQIKSLCQMPARFSTIDEAPWGQRGVRKIIVDNFYIYYLIDDDNLAVYIIAVAYGKREQAKVLENIEI